MPETCTYFSSDDWSERLQEAVDRWPVVEFLAATERVDEPKHVLAELLARADADPLEDVRGIRQLRIGDVRGVLVRYLGVTRDELTEAWKEADVTPDVPASCPHPAEDDRCIFHQPLDKKDPPDVRAALLDHVRADEVRPKGFVGATFHGLDLEYELLASNDLHPINLNLTKFHGDVTLSNAVVAQPLNFRYVTVDGNFTCLETEFARHAAFAKTEFGGTVDCTNAVFEGHTEFEHATFECDYEDRVSFENVFFEHNLTFIGAWFVTSASFTDARFAGIVGFNDATFDESVSFENAAFDRDTSFSEAIIDGSASFDAVTVDGEFKCDGSIFHSGGSFELATFRSDTSFSQAAFSGETSWFRATFLGDVHFSETSFEDPDFTGATFDRIVTFDGTTAEAEITLHRAVLTRGTILQPNDSVTTYDCTQATIRDLELGPPDVERLFDRFNFHNTTFDGFDFAMDGHRQALEEAGWRLDRYVGSGSDQRNHETTYLKAKDGARGMGDTRAASEFFIHEMQERRRGYRTEMHGTFPSSRWLVLAGKRFANRLLDLTSGYGERPWRVVGISAFVIVGSIVPYVLWGGVQRSGPGSAARVGTNWSLPEIVELLYFSLVTFTTVGYGDLQPVGTLSKLFAGLESFAGALLMALLVFVIGRSIKW